MEFTPFRLKVGEVLRTARELQGLSQSELAFLIGVSRTSITNQEFGRQILRIDKLAAACQVLNLTMDKLIDWEMVREETGDRQKKLGRYQDALRVVSEALKD